MVNMTNKIISELKEFYVLPYFISQKYARGRLLILGTNNYSFTENCKLIDDIKYHSQKIENIYTKEIHTNDDKYQLASSLKQILLIFNFEVCSFDILKEQIKGFDNVVLDELYYQIQMYKKAFEYYKIYERVI